MSQLLIIRGSKHQPYTNKFYFSDRVWHGYHKASHTNTHTLKTAVYKRGLKNV